MVSAQPEITVTRLQNRGDRALGVLLELPHVEAFTSPNQRLCHGRRHRDGEQKRDDESAQAEPVPTAGLAEGPQRQHARDCAGSGGSWQ